MTKGSHVLPPSLGESINYWNNIKGKCLTARGRQGIETKKFLDLVEIHFSTYESVEKFAKEMHISSSKLRKCCQYTLNIPPIRCIQARLMAEACVLITNRDLPINEIADELGFKDTGYFSRFFKMHAGQTPRDARIAFINANP